MALTVVAAATTADCVADTTAPQVTLAVEGPTPLVLGQAVTLRVTATDDRAVVQTTLTVNGTPLPLTSTGSAVYVPPAVGTYTVVARATDAAGQVGSATATVVVAANTVAPVVQVAATPPVVALTQPVTITVRATDTIAVTTTRLRVAEPGIPTGRDLTLNAAGQATTTPFQPGVYTLTASAQDPAGNTGTGTATATFEAHGVPDTTPPVVTLSGVSATTAVGRPVTLTVTATNAVGVTARTLLLNDTPQPLDGSGCATYTPPLVGPYTAVATAVDATGNAGTAQLTFQAIDATQDTAAPRVLLTAPIDDATITAPTVVRGTVQDVTLVAWVLEISPQGEERFTTVATGTTEQVDAVLGTLDPTLLRNDLYELRLTAEDANRRIAWTTEVVRIGGQMKVGHLSFTLEDLSLPMVGLPITIHRTYDSRDSAVGDFGVGWRLDIQTLRLQTGRPLGTDWSQGATGVTFPPSYCLDLDPKRAVVLTLPDGHQEIFDFTPTTPAGSRNSDVFGDLPVWYQWLVPIEFG